MATGFVGVEAVVADGLFSLGREVVDDGGDEVGGFEDFEVALGGVVALGAVDDGLGGGVPGDFLEGEGMPEEVFGEAFAAFGIMGGDGFFAAVVNVEAGMLPREEVGEAAGADVFTLAQGVEEAMAEEFDGGGEVFGGHAVEASVGGEESVGGEDVEVGVEDEVIAEGVDGGDGSEFAIGEIEAGAEGFLEGIGGGFEEEMEEIAAFAEDAAKDFGDGEDELAVGDFVADGGGDPSGGLADAALVAGGTEVAALAGEGEEAFVAAIGAVEAEEAGGEVAAAEEVADGGEDVGAERAEVGAVFFLVGGEKGIPSGGEDLPEGRGAGAARLVDGRHKECSYDHFLCGARFRVMV